MDLNTVKRLQKEYGYSDSQKSIENGSVWKFEGSVGREAMRQLESGICYLGTKATYDYYGNRIPSRKDLKEGTKGTRINAINFWKKVQDGDIDIFEYIN